MTLPGQYQMSHNRGLASQVCRDKWHCLVNIKCPPIGGWYKWHCLDNIKCPPIGVQPPPVCRGQMTLPGQCQMSSRFYQRFKFLGLCMSVCVSVVAYSGEGGYIKSHQKSSTPPSISLSRGASEGALAIWFSSGFTSSHIHLLLFCIFCIFFGIFCIYIS